MKKLLFLLVILFSFINFSYSACVDLKTNLVKGNRSQSVLSLQNFLYEKGFLKGAPNGYFGNGTFSAVKNYQKSIDLPQSGKVFSLTRDAIKKETCNSSNISSNINQNTNIKKDEIVFCTLDVMRCPNGSYVGRSGPKCEFIACPKESTSTTTTKNVITEEPVPYIVSIDKKIYFENGIADKGFTLTGLNFGTSTNNIYVTNQSTGVKYFIGNFKPTSGTSTLYASSSLSSDVFSCGPNCSRKLPPGNYELFINNNGSISNSTFFSVKNFGITSTSGTENNAIWGSSTQSLIGRLELSSGVGIVIESVIVDLIPDIGTISYGSTTIKSSYFSNFKFKDEMTGQIMASGGSQTYTFSQTQNLAEFQTKIIGVYADVKSPVSGLLHASFGVNIKDQLLGNKAKLYAPGVHITVSKY